MGEGERERERDTKGIFLQVPAMLYLPFFLRPVVCSTAEVGGMSEERC